MTMPKIEPLARRNALACLLALTVGPVVGSIATSAWAQEAPLVNAEVRKIDHAAQKVTLRHEPIPNLEMDGMTMVFTATKPGMLEGLKIGDRVRFSADKVKGQYLVTHIEAAK